MDYSKECFVFVFVLVFITYVKSSKLILSSGFSYSEVTPCENSDDCDKFVDSICENNICVCNGSRICKDKIQRVVTKIGENCVEDDNCNIEHAECNTDNKCVCKSGYVKSTNGKMCLIISEGIGGSCEDSVQCYAKEAHSGCQDNKCICQQHMHEHRGSCYRTVELGQHCKNNGECAFFAFSECMQSKCACTEKYVASTRGSRCLLIAEGVGSPCVDDAQCTRVLGDASKCTDGFCACKEMYQLKNSTNKCVRDMLLGEVCETHSECHGPFFGISRSECILGVCKCKSFYVEESGYCIEIAYQRCLLDSHCKIINENSFCFGNDKTRPGVCKCVDGYELLSRNKTFFACLQHAGWDEPCEKNVQCFYLLSNNAICDTTCKCREGAHRYIDGRCYPTIRLGDFCQTSANCLLSDGTFGNCVDGRCECKYDKELPTEDAMSCIEARALGEICENNDQCSFISNAVCRVSCRCSAGFALSRDGSSCLKAATTFFEPCEDTVQCSEFLQGSICNNGNCTCLEDHHGFGTRCVRSAGIGDDCTGMESCIRDPKYAEIANCIDGTCQCLPGAVDERIGCNACSIYYNMTIISFSILYLLFNYF